MTTYEIRLMFEWGGGCLWGMNDAAKTTFGYAGAELTLPISSDTKTKLYELSELHEKALDWSNPSAPSPWSEQDFRLFESKALSILSIIQAELGPMYSVWYSPQGSNDTMSLSE